MLKKLWNKYKISIVLFLVYLSIIFCTIIIELIQPTIGANIGGGLAFIVASLFLFASLVSLSFTLSGWKKIIPILIGVILMFLWVYRWNINEDNSNIIFCTDPESGIDKQSKEEFCKKYNL